MIRSTGRRVRANHLRHRQTTGSPPTGQGVANRDRAFARHFATRFAGDQHGAAIELTRQFAQPERLEVVPGGRIGVRRYDVGRPPNSSPAVLIRHACPGLCLGPPRLLSRQGKPKGALAINRESHSTRPPMTRRELVALTRQMA